MSKLSRGEVINYCDACLSHTWHATNGREWCAKENRYPDPNGPEFPDWCPLPDAEKEVE